MLGGNLRIDSEPEAGTRVDMRGYHSTDDSSGLAKGVPGFPAPPRNSSRIHRHLLKWTWLVGHRSRYGPRSPRPKATRIEREDEVA
jgi:hypothetical protein